MNLDISTLPLIDTHEHLVDETYRVNVEKDVLSLFLRHYITTDLANAGLSPIKIEKLRDPSVNIDKRWKELEPFWQQVSLTAYARALKIAVQDLYQYVIHQAIKHELPIQIHTGLLEGSYNNLQNSNPLHLIPLLMQYREARFVLFHGSYPWIREFIALGKMFPNVWLDMCWMWIISPQAGRTILHEVIETIPQNKVTAFGGDYIYIEGTYGHSVIARQFIQRVLEEKIAEGWFGVDEAMQYAKAVLHDNALELYG